MPGRRLLHVDGRLTVDFDRRELLVQGVRAPLGERAFEVFAALVQSAGEVVRKDELMRQVWPGAIVGDNTLEAHVSAVRKALGRERRLLKTAYSRGYRLIGAWTAHPDSPQPMTLNGEAAQPSLSAFSNNLPSVGSDLVGRESAIEQVTHLLSASRVVTLTGVGGIGKTRLALEVTRMRAADYPGDIWFVDLASLADPRFLPSAVAVAVGLSFGNDEISAPLVARAMASRPFLLVLDNCEHLIDACADMVSAIVRLCPRGAVLATSRELLRVDGEHVHRLAPLDVPPVVAEDGFVTSAMRLFITRLQSLRPEFVPTSGDMASIAVICRRLDGIPLAIELAASRAAVLAPAQMVPMLEDRFAMLTRGRRAALPRHQTLRAALDWSYDLLPEDERQLLMSVAVFAASFTFEGAVHVSGPGCHGPAHILDHITALAAKSLVLVDGSGAKTRWRLLETVRAYALDRLVASGNHQRALRLHAEFLAYGSEGVLSARSTVADEIGLSGLPAEIDDVRAALDWSFSPGGDTEVGITITAAYAPVWHRLALFKECHDRVERALQHIEAFPGVNAVRNRQLRLDLAIVLMQTTGFTERPGAIMADVLAMPEPWDDPGSHLRAIWGLWTCRLSGGDHEKARSLAGRFAEVARGWNCPADELLADRLMGNTLHYGGDQPGARQHLQRFLDVYTPPDDGRHHRWFRLDQRLVAQATLARVLCIQGLPDQGMLHALASLEAARTTGDSLAVAYTLGTAVCPLYILRGELNAAGLALAELKAVLTSYHGTFWPDLADCIEGALLIRVGDASKGIGLLLKAVGRSEASVRIPEFVGALAEALARRGQTAEAIRHIEQALARGERGGQRWFVAELCRLKGQVLFAEGDFGSAESWMVRARTISAAQGAMLWELRAIMSLARAAIQRGQRAAAHDLLTSILFRFTEGEATNDLRSARALLAECGSVTPPRQAFSPRSRNQRIRP